MRRPMPADTLPIVVGRAERTQAELREWVRERFREPTALDDGEVVYLHLEKWNYEEAVVCWFLRHDGEWMRLYEVTGKHCSCHGFESQWEPARVTLGALRMRPRVTETELLVLDLLGHRLDVIGFV